MAIYIGLHECHYCGKQFTPDDPIQNEHWKECEKHPAKEEINQLRSEIERLTTGINDLVKRWRDYANEPAASRVGRIVAGDCADELAMLVAE